jgi:hypothetical protein
MVDVLEQSGALKPKATLAEAPPQTRGIEAAITAPMEAISHAVGFLGQKLDELSVPYMQAAGAAAVSRDEQGNPVVDHHMLALSQGSAAYESAARQGALAIAQQKNAEQMVALHNDHQGDPAGFQAAVKTYVRDVGKGGDQLLRPFIQADAASQASEHFRGLLSQKGRADLQNSQVALVTRLEDQKNELRVLARQEGGVNSEAYSTGIDRLKDSYRALASNPLFNFPKERVDSEIEGFRSETAALSAVGWADRNYSRMDRAQAQRFLENNILNNTDLKLSEGERTKLYNAGMGRLAYLDGENKSQIDAHRKTVGILETALTSHKDVPEKEIDDAITKAQTLGDTETVERLGAAWRVYGATRGSAGLSDEQRMEWYQHGPPGARAQAGSDRASMATSFFVQRGYTPEQAAGIVGHLLHEGGLRTDARAAGDGRDGSDSIGIAQWNAERATALKAFAAEKGKPWTDYQTQLEFVDHELRGSEGFAGGQVRSATSVQQAVAAMMHYERPKGYSRDNPQGGLGYAARLRNAERIAEGLPVNPRGAAVASGAPGSVVTQEEMAGKPWLRYYAVKSLLQDETEVVKSATEVAQSISSRVGKQMAPDARNVALVMQLAEQFPEKLSGVRDNMLVDIAGYDEGLRLNGLPSGLGAAAVAEGRRLSQGSSILAQRYQEMVEQTHRAGAENLKKDPWGEALNRHWLPAPIPPLGGEPAAIAEGVAVRGAAAAKIARLNRDSVGSAIAPSDAPAVRAILQSGDPRSVQGLFTGLSKLDDETLFATLSSSDMKTSLTAAANTRDPVKYKPVMAGLDQLWRRNANQFHATLGPDLFSKVQDYQAGLGFETDDALKMRLQRADEGVSGEVRKKWEGQAASEVASTTPQKLADQMKGFFQFGNRAASDPTQNIAPKDMMADYLVVLRDRLFANQGDMDAAKKQAFEKLATVWTVSPTNGGLFMKYAPEKHYPTVDGSHDWIRPQIQAMLREKVGSGITRRSDLPSELDAPAIGPTEVEGADIPFRLVPYSGTEAAIARKEPPVYRLAYQDPKTGLWHDGYWQGDVEQAMAPVRDRLEASRLAAADAARKAEGAAPFIFLQQRGDLPSPVPPLRGDR